MIYRGFDIARKDDGFFHISQDGIWLNKESSEDAAMNWIDAHKRKQAALK